MRILYVAPKYYPRIGGVEYVVKSLATRFAKMGYQVTVLCGEPGIDKPIEEELDNVHVIRWPTLAFNNAYHIPRQRKKFEKFLEELVKTHDITHAHSVHAVISVLPLMMKSVGKFDFKLIMTMHFSTEGYTTFRKIIWKLIWKYYLARNLRSVDAIHATSPIEARTISRHFPLINNKIVTIPIGIEDDVMHYTWEGVNSDYILYSGRLEKYKHVDLIIDAVSLLVRAGNQIRLVVVGSGSYKERIIDKAKKAFREAPNHFIYFPPRSRKEYLELLSEARAVINLSEAENFNIFLAEAYAIGLPIVATRGAAAFCPQLANVRRLEPEHIAEVILKILHTRNNSTFHGCLLKTWSGVVEDLENLYKRLYQGMEGGVRND